jgi:hypothetical protein
MKIFKDEDELEIFSEGYCEKIKEETFFKGCPNCKTDAYLMDIE